jgi:hypothetical protein
MSTAPDPAQVAAWREQVRQVLLPGWPKPTRDARKPFANSWP